MPTTSVDRADRRAWVGLALLTLPTMLLSVDLTVLHLAIPHLSADLRPSATQLLWIADIYGFIIAGLLITMGSLGDRFGRRRLLLLGAGAFAATSALAAYSPTPETLLVARAALGAAGATLMPSTLAIIRTMFHDEAQRAYAVAIWMTSFMVGGALGPLLGGILLEWFWWGAMFLMAVPIMGTLALLGPFVLPESRDPDPGPIDLLSVVQSIAATLLLVYGVKETAHHGWHLDDVLIMTLGLVLGSVFVRRQRRLAHPLLDLSLFKRPRFSAAVAAQLMAFFTMGGVQLFVMQHLQLVLELSPLKAGLWSLPAALAAIVASMAAPAVAARTGAGRVLSLGLVVAAAGLAVLARTSLESGVWWIVLSFTIMSIGLAPVFSLGAGLVVSAAPPERAGAASAVQETASELGLAAGMAVLGSIGLAVYHGRLSEVYDVVGQGPDPREGTLADVLATADGLAGPAAETLVAAANAAFVHGFATVAATSAAVLLVAAAATFLGLNGPWSRQADQDRRIDRVSS